MKKVKVGQIYMDNDPRTKGERTLQVTKVELVTMPTSKKGNYGNVAEFADCDVYRNGVKTGTTRIHATRMMKPSSSGYGYVLMDVHTLPVRERELKYADDIVSVIDSLLDAAVHDIDYHLGILSVALVAYKNVRLGT